MFFPCRLLEEVASHSCLQARERALHQTLPGLENAQIGRPAVEHIAFDSEHWEIDAAPCSGRTPKEPASFQKVAEIEAHSGIVVPEIMESDSGYVESGAFPDCGAQAKEPP